MANRMQLDSLATLEELVMDWNLADAKNRFSEVVNLALTEGPQRIRRRKDTVVVVAAEEFRTADRACSPHSRTILAHGESFEGLESRT